MPHNLSSARGTVLQKDPSSEKPTPAAENAIGQMMIVGGIIGAFVLLALIIFVVLL